MNLVIFYMYMLTAEMFNIDDNDKNNRKTEQTK